MRLRPKWLGTAAWFAGMALVWTARRVLGEGAASTALAAAGTALVALAAAALFLQSRAPGAGATAERRHRSRMAWLALAGLLALGLHALGAEIGGKAGVALAVAWPLVWLAAALPLLFMELAFATMSRDGVEGWRLAASGRSALVLVLALGTLGFANYVASRFDWKADWSYLKTKRPSEATLEVLADLDEPVDVVLFYPPANEVAGALLLYLESLAAADEHVRLRVVEHAREPALAEAFDVTGDGTLVIARGGKHEAIHPGLDLDRAKLTLKSLDGEVRRALARVVREDRVAYFTTGHGERDWSPTEEDRRAGRDGLRELKGVLEDLNVRVERLGLAGGLGSAVPADASVVFVVGPREPFQPAEIASLRAYLARGGRLVLCVDPGAPGDPEHAGPLLALAGLALKPGTLANDRAFLRERNDDSDHFLLFSNRFVYHPSVATLDRFSDRAAVIFPGVGTLEETGEPNGPRVTFTIRSLPDTWIDLDRDAVLDEPDEARAIHSIAAAVEERAADEGETDHDGGPDGDEREPWRAVVVADADWLADGVLRNPGNLQAVVDALAWLAGDDAVPVESEEDVPIVHTREQDVAWFYGTIVAAPLGVLGAGLVTLRRRRSGGSGGRRG